MFNVFDVYAKPSLAHALVLANVMSDRLWNLSSKTTHTEPIPVRLAQYQLLIDKYFTHLSPAQVAQINGVLDIEHERQRLGADVVDAALENIVDTFAWRTERGTLTNIDSTMELIRDGQFPNVTYGAIDVLHDRLVATGKKSARSVGLSSCLDEAALFAALVMTADVEDIDGIVMLGSASHYTVFIWSGIPGSSSFDAWWFYGKNTLYSLADYRAVLAEDYAGDYQLAFSDRLPGMDTVIAREGSWRLGESTHSLSPQRIELLTAALDEFCGGRTVELDRGLAQPLVSHEHSASEALFESSLNLASADQVRAVVTAASSPTSGAAELAKLALQLAS